jgi:tripartite-type tricarboxylate transporter receptor subunit TctC
MQPAINHPVSCPRKRASSTLFGRSQGIAHNPKRHGVLDRPLEPALGRREAPIRVRAIAFLLVAMSCLLSTHTAAADPVADFYHNRTVSLVIGFGVGGDDDLWGRLVGKHLGRHIPGNPAVTVQNLPGAAGLVLMNRLANAAPRDGTVIAMVNRGIAFEPLLGGAGTQFDPLAMTYIGSPNRDTTVCAARRDAAVRRMADLFTTELKVGATGSGADTAIYPEFLAALLGMKFNVVKGYSGSREVTLAIERNEVQGICLAYDSLNRSPFVRDVGVNILLQVAETPDPRFPQVPLGIESAQDPRDRAALQLFLARTLVGRPFVAPPALPAERTAALRAAFDGTLKDAEFLADAARQQARVVPVSGPEIVDILAAAYRSPPDVVERTIEALGRKSRPAK